MIITIALCVSLFANIMFLWGIVCLCDDLDQYKSEAERLTMYVDRLLYNSDRGRDD